jgi:hypothetical protein
VPRLGERLLAGLDWRGVPEALAERARAAEAALYDDPHDPSVNWDDADLERWVRAAGLRPLHREVLRHPVELVLSGARVRRWFGDEAAPGRLAQRLGADAPAVRAYLERVAGGAPVRRVTATVLLVAERVETD